MEALYLQIFVSFVLVIGSLLLFAHSVRQRDDEHADRLALFPIEEERSSPRPRAGSPGKKKKESHGGSDRQ